MATDSYNPFLRPPLRRRVVRGIGTAARVAARAVTLLPVTFYRQFRAAPIAVRVPLAAAILAALGGGGYYLAELRGERVRQSQIVMAWQEFESKAAGGAETDELIAVIDRVIALNPDDPVAARRRAELEAESADPDDPAMAAMLLRRHYVHNRIDSAAREAEKRLAARPNDWLAHCALAARGLARRDAAAAAPHLDALATPDSPGNGIDPFGMLTAIGLLTAAGRDARPVRAFVIEKVLPSFRGEQVVLFPPVVQAGLIALYADAFAAGPDAAPALAGYWAPAARLAALALDEATKAGSTLALVMLADQGPILAAGLAGLRVAGQVTPEEAKALAAELEERTRTAWRAVREKDPKAAAAYQGLALSYLRGGDPAAAGREVADGLRACGDEPRLLALASLLMQREDRADEAMALLLTAAGRNPNSAALWLTAAEAAAAARRRDVALAACQKARAVAPTLGAAVYLEAQLWLEAGKPAEALVLLRKFSEAELAREPAAAHGYARALVEAGEANALDGFLKKVEAAARAANRPAVWVAALRGVFDAPPDPDRAAKVAEAAGHVVALWGTDPAAALLRAEAAARQIDLGRGSDALARQAVQAFELAAALNPADLRAAGGLAWLRVRTGGDPRRALKDAAPLAAAEATLPVESAEVLGYVYLANGRADDALRVLDRARRSRQVTAGCLVQLARAYHARGQKADAAAALAAARRMPQSGHEQADFRAAVNLLQQDTR
jgi:predicted Zn-dependent protease